MIELGDSSIMKLSPPSFMPEYEPSKRRVTWPNGAVAIAFYGDEPGQLRGPAPDTVWMDELAKFKYPEESWDMMEFALRTGPQPQVCVSTTPRPIPIIKRLLKDPRTVDVTGSTYENEANLSDSFIMRIKEKYEGTRLGRQEIHAEILDDMPGALWNRDLLDKTRVSQSPTMARIAVGVDPAASTGETGIVVVGIAAVGQQWHGYTLDDRTMPGSPGQWGSEVVATYHKWHADVIVGEVNNGGDMIEHVIRGVPGGANVSYKSVRATRGKYVRAEPVANLFEQGRGHHVGYFADLEDQECSYVPGDAKSPNNLDAEVWAYHELLLQEQEVEEIVYYDDHKIISPF
jgi:phage terminase large subunit-like protein